MSTKLPTLPSPVAPAVSMPSGTLNREWFLLLQALLAALADLDRRLTALES